MMKQPYLSACCVYKSGECPEIPGKGNILKVPREEIKLPAQVNGMNLQIKPGLQVTLFFRV